MKILESNRLILRPWKISDLDDLHEFISNEKVANLAGFNRGVLLYTDYGFEKNSNFMQLKIK